MQFQVGRTRKPSKPEFDNDAIAFDEDDNIEPEPYSPAMDSNLTSGSQEPEPGSEDTDSLHFRQSRQKTLTRVPQLSTAERR
jgi:hypothetical protein